MNERDCGEEMMRMRTPLRAQLTVRFAACLGGAALMLAGCAPHKSALDAGALPATSGATPTSWMARGAAKSDLLYVTDGGEDYTYVFDYPSGTPKGTLNTPGFGLCSDAKGNVYVVDGEAFKIFVYAHGGIRPIRALDGSGRVWGCDVDPASGTLAVTSANAGGGISLYAHGKGAAISYSDGSLIATYFCGFDGSGNLYVDGLNQYYDFALDELHKGGSRLQRVALDGFIDQPGAVVWDGAHLAIGDAAKGLVYRFRMSKNRGREVAYTTLRGGNPAQFVLYDATLIGGVANDRIVNVWNYPKGGSPVATISDDANPYGVALSLAANRSKTR